MQSGLKTVFKHPHSPEVGGAVRIYRQLFLGSAVIEKLHKEDPQISCMLNFAPAEAVQADFGSDFSCLSMKKSLLTMAFF